ncbi:toxin (plasmid) [Pseudomonas luteola]|uniref:colicin E3/pyocin S6 family cytotoxin n=1 Tax=Pseudomonas luteola TaxID=47886 RepID=UPI00388EC553
MSINQGPGPVPNVPRPARPNNILSSSVSGNSVASSRELSDIPAAIKKPEEPRPVGCVFAKSCNIPKSEFNYSSLSGFIPVDSLSSYGAWAVLGSTGPAQSGAITLGLIGGTATGSSLISELGGGVLSLGRAVGAVTAGTATSFASVLVGLLIPTQTADDDVFYTDEQMTSLSVGRTRVRIHVRQLPDGAVDGYGLYTGKNPDWEMVPVIKATARGEQFVADLGGGNELIWTPAADPDDHMGIPALAGAPGLPNVWVYPPGEKTDQALINPVYPTDYQDAIIWFPTSTVKPIYIVLNSSHTYHPAPKDLPAFPEAKKAKPKTAVQGGGGLRKRWKDQEGKIYEWDSQHGAVEIYNKRGKHIGEFNHITGEQNKGADGKREVEP